MAQKPRRGFITRLLQNLGRNPLCAPVGSGRSQWHDSVAAHTRGPASQLHFPLYLNTHSPLMNWHIPQALAGAARLGRSLGSTAQVSAGVVKEGLRGTDTSFS